MIMNRPRTMIPFIDLCSLFHSPRLAHMVTPQQAAGNCKLKKVAW